MTKHELEVLQAAEFFARDWTDPKATANDREIRVWFLVLAVGRLNEARKRHAITDKEAGKMLAGKMPCERASR